MKLILMEGEAGDSTIKGFLRILVAVTQAIHTLPDWDKKLVGQEPSQGNLGVFLAPKTQIPEL